MIFVIKLDFFWPVCMDNSILLRANISDSIESTSFLLGHLLFKICIVKLVVTF